MSIVGCWCLPHHLIFFSFKSKERIKWNKHNVCPTEEQEEAKEGKMLSLLRREDERNNWEELSTTTRFQQKLDEQLKLQYEVYQEKKVRFDMKSAFNECIEWFALFWSPILMEINSHPKQDKNQGKSNQSLTGLISFNHLSKWNKKFSCASLFLSLLLSSSLFLCNTNKCSDDHLDDKKRNKLLKQTFISSPRREHLSWQFPWFLFLWNQNSRF